MIDEIIGPIYAFQRDKWKNIITPAFFCDPVDRHFSDKDLPVTSVDTPYTSLSEFGDRIATTVCIPVAGVQHAIQSVILALAVAIGSISELLSLKPKNAFQDLEESGSLALMAAVTLVVTAAFTAWQLFATLFKLLPTVANMMKPGAGDAPESDDKTFNLS